MAREDFFIKFGSNAPTWAKGLRGELKPADDAIAEVARTIAALDNYSAKAERRISNRLTNIARNAEATAKKLTSLPTDTPHGGGGGGSEGMAAGLIQDLAAYNSQLGEVFAGIKVFNESLKRLTKSTDKLAGPMSREARSQAGREGWEKSTKPKEGYFYPKGTIQGQVDQATGQIVRALAKKVETRAGITVQKGQPLPDGWKIGGRAAKEGDVGAVLRSMEGQKREQQKAARNLEEASRELKRSAGDKKASVKDVRQATISAAAMDKLVNSLNANAKATKRVEAAINRLGDRLAAAPPANAVTKPAKAEPTLTKAQIQAAAKEAKKSGKDVDTILAELAGAASKASKKPKTLTPDEMVVARDQARGIDTKKKKNLQAAAAEAARIDDQLTLFELETEKKKGKKAKENAAKVQTAVQTVSGEIDSARKAMVDGVREALKTVKSQVGKISDKALEGLVIEAEAQPLDRKAKRKLTTKNKDLLDLMQKEGGVEQRQATFQDLVGEAGGRVSRRMTNLAKKVVQYSDELTTSIAAQKAVRERIAKGGLKAKELETATAELARREKETAAVQAKLANVYTAYANRESRQQTSARNTAAANMEARRVRALPTISEALSNKEKQELADLRFGANTEAIEGKFYTTRQRMIHGADGQMEQVTERVPGRGANSLSLVELKRIADAFLKHGYAQAAYKPGDSREAILRGIVDAGKEYGVHGTSLFTEHSGVDRELKIAEGAQKVLNYATRLDKLLRTEKPALDALIASMKGGGGAPWEPKGKGALEYGSAIGPKDLGFEHDRESIQKEMEALDQYRGKLKKAAYKDLGSALHADPAGFDPYTFEPGSIQGPRDEVKGKATAIKTLQQVTEFFDTYAREVKRAKDRLNTARDRLAQIDRDMVMATDPKTHQALSKERREVSREESRAQKDYERATSDAPWTEEFLLRPDIQAGVRKREASRAAQAAAREKAAADAELARQQRADLRAAAAHTLFGARTFTDQYGNSRDATTRLLPGYRTNRAGSSVRLQDEFRQTPGAQAAAKQAQKRLDAAKAAGKSEEEVAKAEKQLEVATKALEAARAADAREAKLARKIGTSARGYSSAILKLEEAMEEGTHSEDDLNKLRARARAKLESLLDAYSRSLPGKGRPILNELEFLPESMGFEQVHSERYTRLKARNESAVEQEAQYAALGGRRNADEVLGPRAVRLQQELDKQAAVKKRLTKAEDKEAAATEALKTAKDKYRASLNRADRAALESAEATIARGREQAREIRAKAKADNFDQTPLYADKNFNTTELRGLLSRDVAGTHSNMYAQKLEEAQASGLQGPKAEKTARKATNDFFDQYAKLQRQVAEATTQKARRELQKQIDAMRGQLRSDLRDDKGRLKDTRLRDYAGRDVFSMRTFSGADYNDPTITDVRKVGTSRRAKDYEKAQTEIAQLQEREKTAQAQIDSVLGSRVKSEQSAEKTARSKASKVRQELALIEASIRARQAILVDEVRERAVRRAAVTYAEAEKAQAKAQATGSPEDIATAKAAEQRFKNAAKERNRLNGKAAYETDEGEFRPAVPRMSDSAIAQELLEKYKGRKVSDFNREVGPTQLIAERKQLQRQGNYSGADVKRLADELERAQKAQAKLKKNASDKDKQAAEQAVKAATKELEDARARKSRLAQIRQALRAIEESTLSDADRAAAEAKRASGKKAGPADSPISDAERAKLTKERDKLKAQGPWSRQDINEIQGISDAAEKARRTAKGQVTRAEKAGDAARIKAAKKDLEAATAEAQTAQQLLDSARARRQRLQEIKARLSGKELPAAGGDGADSGSGGGKGGKGGSSGRSSESGGGNYSSILAEILKAVRQVNTTLRGGLKITGTAVGGTRTATAAKPAGGKPVADLKALDNEIAAAEKALADLGKLSPTAKRLRNAETKLEEVTSQEAAAREAAIRAEEARTAHEAAQRTALAARDTAARMNEVDPDNSGQLREPDSKVRANAERNADKQRAAAEASMEEWQRLQQEADQLAGPGGLAGLEKEVKRATTNLKRAQTMASKEAAAQGTAADAQKSAADQAKAVAKAERRLATALEAREKALAAQAKGKAATKDEPAPSSYSAQDRQRLASTPAFKSAVPDLLETGTAEEELAKALTLTTNRMLSQARAVEFFTGKLGLSAEARKKFAADLKALNSTAQQGKESSNAELAASKQRQREEEKTKRAVKERAAEEKKANRISMEGALAEAKEAGALKLAGQAAQQEAQKLAQLHAAQGHTVATANQMAAVYQKVHQALAPTGASTSTINSVTQHLINQAGQQSAQINPAQGGFKVNSQTISQVAGLAQQTATQVNSTVQNIMGRTLFGNSGFVNRVINSTGTFIVRNFSAGLVFGITNAMQQVVAEAIKAEQTFVRVSHALEQTGRDTGNLRSGLEDISAKYGQNLSDTYEVAAGLVGLFKSTENIQFATEIVSQLQLISDGALNAQESLGVLASTTSAFGQQFAQRFGGNEEGIKESLKHVADVFTVVQNNIGTNIEVASEGVSRFSGLANQLGLSMEEATVYVSQVAKLTNQGGDAAGEQLSRIMQSLGTGRSRTALGEAFGQNIINALNDGDYSQVLKIMGQGWDDLTEQQKNNLSITIAGQRQAASFAGLMHDNTTALNTIKEATLDKGAADERASKLLDTLMVSVARFTSELQDLASELIQMGIVGPFILLLKAVNATLSGVNNLAQGFNHLTDDGALKYLKYFAMGLLGIAAAAAITRRAISGFGGAAAQIAATASGAGGGRSLLQAGLAGAARPTGTPLVARPAFNTFNTGGFGGGSLIGRGAAYGFNRFVQRPLQYMGIGAGMLFGNTPSGPPTTRLGLAAQSAEQRLQSLRATTLTPTGGTAASRALSTTGTAAYSRMLSAQAAALKGADRLAQGLGRVGSAMGNLSKSGLALDAALIGVTILVTKLIEESNRQKGLAEAGQKAQKNLFGEGRGMTADEQAAAEYFGPATEAFREAQKNGPSKMALGWGALKGYAIGGMGGLESELGKLYGTDGTGMTQDSYGVAEVQKLYEQAAKEVKGQSTGDLVRQTFGKVTGPDGALAKYAAQLDQQLKDEKISGAQYDSAYSALEQAVSYLGDDTESAIAALSNTHALTVDQVQHIQMLIQNARDLAGGTGGSIGVDITPYLEELYKDTGVDSAQDPRLKRQLTRFMKGGMNSVDQAINTQKVLRTEVARLQDQYTTKLLTDPEAAKTEVLPELQSAISQLGQAGQGVIDAIKQQAADIADAALSRGDVDRAIKAYDRAADRILNQRAERLKRLRAEYRDRKDAYDAMYDEGGIVGAMTRKIGAPTKVSDNKAEKQRQRQENKEIRDLIQQRIQAQIDRINRHYDRLIAQAGGQAARAAIEAERGQAITGVYDDALSGKNGKYVDTRAAQDAKTKAIQSDRDAAIAAAENNIAGLVLQAAGIWNEAAQQAAQENIALQQWNDAKAEFGRGSTEALNAHQNYVAQQRASVELADSQAAAAQQTAIAAIPQGNTVGVARANLAAAQAAVARARKYGVTSTQYQGALAQLYAAQQQVTSATTAVAVAQAQLAQAYAQANGSAVAAARAGVAVARATLAAALKASGGARSAEVLAAQAQLVAANDAVGQAITDQIQAKIGVAIAIAEAAGHTVQAARLQIKQALAALRAANPGAERYQAQAQVIQARAAARDAALQDQLDTIDFNLQMGKITQSSAIHALEEILKTRNLTKEQRRQLLLQIKGMKDEMADSQWNFGDIKLPTPYQMKRYIEERKKNLRDEIDSAIGHSDGRRPRELQSDAGFRGGSMRGGGASNRVENHTTTINIDGADLAQVKKIIKEVVGGNVTVRTAQGRRR